VICLCKIARDATKPLCVLPGELGITARHPVVVDGDWMLPQNHPHASQVLTGTAACVYNVVLDRGHTIV
jgi:hypothetical protein